MADPHAAALGHVVPLRVLVAVFAALVLLTGVTVAVAGVDLGDLNIFVALGIATAKALLVLSIFMHLRYEKPILTLIVGAAILCVAIFIALVMADTTEYAAETQTLEQRLDSR